MDENIVEQMLNDIRREEKTEDISEHDIKILLDRIIDRDIKRTKEKLKQEEDISSFEKNFALNFVGHMWVYICLIFIEKCDEFNETDLI